MAGSVIGVNTIRGRLRQLSTAAQARRADGTPLVLEPHDCRRAFASEHLNNNTRATTKPRRSRKTGS